jgi:hypothetical protein
LNFFIFWIDADVSSLVFSGFDGQQEKVEFDVTDFGDLREGHSHEGRRQRLGDDELVARVQVVALPLWNVCRKQCFDLLLLPSDYRC